MKFVDSHCHLHMLDYAQLNMDMEAVVDAAKAHHVAHMICVSTELSEFETLRDISNRFESVTISTGLHPNETLSAHPNHDVLFAHLQHEKVVALGETGLDYYRSPTSQQIQAQKEWFVTHIDVAKKMKKPLIVHTRMAKADTIAILKNENARDAGAVLHCFTEDWEMAKKALDLDLYLSFSGIITFKNADELREVVKKVPIDRLLIETDAPFLAPVPYRGKINQPAYVVEVAAAVAALKSLTVEAVAAQTTANFERLFHLKV